MVDAYEMENGISPILGYDDGLTPVINPASGYVEPVMCRQPKGAGPRE